MRSKSVEDRLDRMESRDAKLAAMPFRELIKKHLAAFGVNIDTLAADLENRENYIKRQAQDGR